MTRLEERIAELEQRIADLAAELEEAEAVHKAVADRWGYLMPKPEPRVRALLRPMADTLDRLDLVRERYTQALQEQHRLQEQQRAKD